MTDFSKNMINHIDTSQASRRKFLIGSGAAGLSAAAVALIGGKEALASKYKANEHGDVTILSTALGAEREAIAAYQLGAESGLLSKGVLDVAVAFQGHHKEHADVLAATITSLGGVVPAAPTQYNFPVSQLKKERDVLAFAAGLEQGAVSAYLGAVPLFDNRDLSAAAASILGDEAMHWAVLRQALGLNPVPGAFVS
ncbi:ferritin-like domain-containing protein [Kordiimonas aquimaris]|uniref:ferritin-like domain-containing protein n=1 Tax=Kordiimonas aquimaris TaxID=707591 RepID=UPI0021CE4BC7|nr:ferritin-like domain-containing protein [Kordiimonas aquimaris]